MHNRTFWNKGILSLFVIATALMLSACFDSAAPPPPTRTPAPTFTPAPPATLPPTIDPNILAQATANALAATATSQALAQEVASDENGATTTDVAAPQPANNQVAGQDQQPEAGQAPVDAPNTPVPVQAVSTPVPQNSTEVTAVEGSAVVAKADVYVRSGPGTTFEQIGGIYVKDGQRYSVIGRNADSTWWQIDYEGQEGWVYYQPVTVVDAGSVAIAANIPQAPQAPQAPQVPQAPQALQEPPTATPLPYQSPTPLPYQSPTPFDIPPTSTLIPILPTPTQIVPPTWTPIPYIPPPPTWTPIPYIPPPPTWTPVPTWTPIPYIPPPPTPTPWPTSTPWPTATPWPTPMPPTNTPFPTPTHTLLFTYTPIPTNTPIATDTPIPTNTPDIPPTPVPPPPTPEPQFPFVLVDDFVRCDPNEGVTYFNGFVRHRDNSPRNAVCIHINFYEPRKTKCSGCDGVGDGIWGFSPFGGPAPPGTPVEIYVVECPGPLPLGGQGNNFGNLTPQSPKWTYTVGESTQCTGITFVGN